MGSEDSSSTPGINFTGIGVIFFCHDGEGNVVMSLRGDNCRDERNRWDIGGGCLHFGEKMEDTIRREVNEEYQTNVLKIEFLGYREVFRKHPDSGLPTHWVAFDFKVLVGKEIANGEPHKFDDVRWFPINSMPSPVHSELPVFLENYNDKLN